MLIRELFDRPETLKKTTDIVGLVIWEGIIGEDLLKVTAREIDESVWVFEFTVGGRQDVRGDKGSDAVKIFSTVINTLSEFTQDRKPETILFSAAKEEFGQETGRAQLYSRMTKRFASAMGYKIETHDQGDHELFQLTRQASHAN